MKVRVAFTVEVDEQAWMTAYGIDRKDVRADINEYVKQALLEHLETAL